MGWLMGYIMGSSAPRAPSKTAEKLRERNEVLTKLLEARPDPDGKGAIYAEWDAAVGRILASFAKADAEK